jgi:hypothetical protein
VTTFSRFLDSVEVLQEELNYPAVYPILLVILKLLAGIDASHILKYAGHLIIFCREMLACLFEETA